MNLAIFADGTWNRREPGGRGTNVVKLSNATVDDPAQGQEVFYDPGVGTNMWEKLGGGLFGVGISENIKQCYRFLVERWKSTDEAAHQLFLFGFSRGAYTVRSLGGLLGRIGLVNDVQHIDEAYDLYRKARPKQRNPAIDQFQKTHVVVKPLIRMIGVWDTVGALGIPLNALNKLNPFPHEFHDTSLGPRVQAAYHAVAVDERRVAYVPTLWDPLPAGSTQILEQVFFSGVHSDVGGGYQDDCKLGDITLEWMARRAVSRGLLLKQAEIPQCGIPNCYGQMHSPMKYIPIRREAREIRNGRISRTVRHRWEAPERTCNPYPYETTNLKRDGEYEWMEWPENPPSS